MGEPKGSPFTLSGIANPVQSATKSYLISVALFLGNRKEDSWGIPLKMSFRTVPSIESYTSYY
ncbi:hypothetical protein [Arsenophonus nasoniae]|uniref:hypothetical protein n=1 Tax=Arsenophonus nasoniae TaxID=638 RepID=UPI00387958C6